MPVLEFREIPEANSSGVKQDTFELFARDFLLTIGYKVQEGPDRGPDAGRDLIVLETRMGIGGETEVRWLASCKHRAHSGRSVTVEDEQDIKDRVSANHCDGFIGIYSTLPSAPLQAKLKGLKEEGAFSYQFFDHESIERKLLESFEGQKLAARYFPRSFATWTRENPRPAKIFSDAPRLLCEYCGRDLTPEKGVKGLRDKNSGIVVMWETNLEGRTTKTEHIYWCCKGECDLVLKSKYHKNGFIDGWEDIPDLTIPLLYLKFVMAIINGFHRGDEYSEHALDKLKELVVALFPYVARDATSEERERVDRLSWIPEWA